MRIILVALFSFTGAILLIGIGHLFHGYLVPTKSPTQKYKLYKAIRWYSLATKEGVEIICIVYSFSSIVLFSFLFALLPGPIHWIAVLLYSMSIQAPYLLASLSLAQVDNKTAIDAIGLKYYYSRDLIENIGLALLIMFIDFTQKTRMQLFPQAILASCLVFSATMTIAIWLINGGGGRISGRLKAKLKKPIQAKPRVTLNPVP